MWDGTRRWLAAVLTAVGAETQERAARYQFTLATHPAVSFSEALPATRDVTDLVRKLVPA